MIIITEGATYLFYNALNLFKNKLNAYKFTNTDQAALFHFKLSQEIYLTRTWVTLAFWSVS